MDSKITIKTRYVTADGAEFTYESLAKHHIKVCNILTNCFLPNPKSEHYHTIWELIKHFNIVDRDDAEYIAQEENDLFMDNAIEDQDWFITGVPSIEKIRELLR